MRPKSGIKPGHVVLERALSKLGLASRTVAKKWIEEGRVRVNGVTIKNARFQVVPEKAKIEIDGEKVDAEKKRTFLLNKPKGFVTTNSDEKGRPTVFSLLEKVGLNLHSVGRLDQATTGLLILTNDTRLSSWLTDPKNGVVRVYLVSVRGELSEGRLKELSKGVVDGDDLLKAVKITIRKSSARETHLIVALDEGKNREIRRMFKAIGHEVTRLKRVSYGLLELGELESGKYLELTDADLRKSFPEFYK